MPGWRTVKVFLSSTFRDMHAERDHLIKVTFPYLRERLLPHRVELYDIDLRWGITEDEAKNEQVIGLCLEQIDECRPFFLAFLGNRYGWVPGQIPQDTLQRFPFVQRFPGVSVTELELRHGAILDPTDKYTLVLVRKDEAVASIPEATRMRDFIESDPRLQQRLAALKQELQAGPYAVQLYSATWDPKHYDRVNRSEGKLTQLDVFGKKIEDWLWEAIRWNLQLPDAPAEVDLLDAEADLHERFLELRTRIYVGRDDLYRELRNFALASGETPLLLTGESGLGKSAALARFVRDFRKERSDVFVVAQFVGASPRTTSLAGMLQRLTQELKRKFNLMLPKAETLDEIIRTFIVALTSIPESARVVLVFDALNQLDADSRADSLIWLPVRLPPNARVLCSSATGPQKAPRVLSAFGKREYVDVPLRPLSENERRAIVKAVPKLVAKTLDDKQIDAMLANPATRNPLFLMVALEELRGYGSFERLNEMIAGLPREGDTVTQLFDQVFERLEQEFNKPLVDWTLRLLACSRRGLSGPELVALTRNLGEQAEDLYPVLRQLRPHLHVRRGLFDFYHMSIRRAVEIRYLHWHTEEDQRDPWARWDKERQSPASEPSAPERETRQRLIGFFGLVPSGKSPKGSSIGRIINQIASAFKAPGRTTPTNGPDRNELSPRSVAELPWQLSQLRSWRRLCDLLGDVSFFVAAWETDPFDIRRFWTRLESESEFRMRDSYRPVIEAPSRFGTQAKFAIATLMCDAGHLADAMSIFRSMAEHDLASGNLDRYARILAFEANLVADVGNLEEAMAIYRRQEKLLREMSDPYGLLYCLGNQGIIFRDRGDSAEAMKLYKQQECICRELGYKAGLELCLGNQALVLWDQGDLEGAIALLMTQQEICREVGDELALSTSLGNLAEIVAGRGELDRAAQLAGEQEKICRELAYKRGLATCLLTQASILCRQGEAEQAMRVLREQERVSRELGDPTPLAISLANQGLLLVQMGELENGISRVEEGRKLAEHHGLTSVLKRIAPIVAKVHNRSAGIAAVILDMPMDYHRSTTSQEIWQSLAMSVVPSKEDRSYLELKLAGIPKDWLIVLVTAEANVAALRQFLARHVDLGFPKESTYYCSPARSPVRDANGDPAVDDAGKRLLMPEGSLSAMRALFESRVLDALVDRGVKMLRISFIENDGASCELRTPGLLLQKDVPLLAEIMPWEGEQGPMFGRFNSKTVLLEREYLSDVSYASLLKQEMPCVGTNTYWLHVARAMAVLGLSRGDLAAAEKDCPLELPFEKVLHPIITARAVNGSDVLFSDLRLSLLTVFFDALFVLVPRARRQPCDRGTAR